jgi:hypothetical protein
VPFLVWLDGRGCLALEVERKGLEGAGCCGLVTEKKELC